MSHCHPRLALCRLLLVGLVLSSVCHADKVSWFNPESLTPPLDQPLRQFATTDNGKGGHDYLEVPAGGKLTVATITGPAVIFRIWSTAGDTSKIKLELNIDGQSQVLYAAGKLPESVKPDATRNVDGEAYWSYVPLAVQGQAVFTATNLGTAEPLKVFVQVDYRPVKPEQLRLVSPATVQQITQFVGARQESAMWGLNGQGSQTGEVTRRRPWTAQFPAPSLVRALVFDAGAAPFEQIAATRLTITCDGNRSIDVPFAALFGEYFGLSDYTSAGTAVAGRLFCLRLPMPVEKSLSVAISQWQRGRPLRSLRAFAYAETLPHPPAYRLCAQYFSAISQAGQPLQLLNATGPGLYVGLNLAVDGLEHKSFSFLEGNEQMYVDGSPKPTFEGTGTEDYFNSAWYFRGQPVTRAFHGVVFKQEKDPPRVVAYRYQIADCLAFSKSLRIDLQHGSHNSSPDTLYRSVVFWYQKSPGNVAEPVEARVSGKAGGPAGPAGLRPSGLGLGLMVVVVMVLVLGARRLFRRTRRG
jgi:hypothetical protein